MPRNQFCLATALLALASTASFGQDAMLDELYGRGVHAFFSGNQTEAFNSFNAAVQNGSRDPRTFYYRGLVLNRFGRPDEAQADFRKGAELEMIGGEPYSVGRALERIQGTERMNLEAQRRVARLAIHTTQTSNERARYEQIQRAEGEVIRGRGPTAPPPPPAPGRPDASDPFSTPEAPATLPPPADAPARLPAVAPPPPPAAPMAEDPFAEAPPAAPATAPAPRPTPPAPAPAPPAADPFAEPATPAPAPAPATPPAPAPNPPAADPFAEPTTPAPAAPPAPAPVAAPAPPAADPFAEPTTPAPAPVNPPPAPAPAPPAADPFAEPAPTPPAPAPATP